MHTVFVRVAIVVCCLIPSSSFSVTTHDTNSAVTSGVSSTTAVPRLVTTPFTPTTKTSVLYTLHTPLFDPLLAEPPSSHIERNTTSGTLALVLGNLPEDVLDDAPAATPDTVSDYMMMAVTMPTLIPTLTPTLTPTLAPTPVSHTVALPTRRSDVRQWFEQRVDDHARKIVAYYFDLAPQYGVNPVLALTQAVLETGWFRSWWAVEHHNYAGLWVSGAVRTSPPTSGYWVQQGNRWIAGRSFASVEEGVRTHLAVLQRYCQRQQTTISAIGAVWARDPHYAAKWRAVIASIPAYTYHETVCSL